MGPDLVVSLGTIYVSASANHNPPLGFKSQSQFLASMIDLQKTLISAGITDATVGVRGSAVLGSSSYKQALFNDQSDIDLFFESQAASLMKLSGATPGLVHPSNVRSALPAIGDYNTKWSNALERTVSVGAWIPWSRPAGDPSIIFLPR